MSKVYDKGAGSNALREEVSPPRLPTGSPVAGGLSFDDILRIVRMVDTNDGPDAAARHFLCGVICTISVDNPHFAAACARYLGFAHLENVCLYGVHV